MLANYSTESGANVVPTIDYQMNQEHALVIDFIERVGDIGIPLWKKIRR